MLKKVIPFKDFDGNDRTEVAYFHITKTELTDLVANDTLDPDVLIQANADGKQTFKMMKTLVELSYGIRSEDGTSFIKDEANLKRFKQSLAYDSFIMSMLTDNNGNSFLDFVKGVFPEDIVDEVMQSMEEGPRVSAVSANAEYISSPLKKPAVDTEDPAFIEAVTKAVEERMGDALSRNRR